MRSKLPIACLAGCLLLCSPSAFATRYSFVLDDTQVVPGPSGSSATGTAVAVLNDTQTTVSLAVQHNVDSPIAGGIYRGDFGTNGTLIFSLPSLEPQFVVNWEPAPSEVDDLIAGLLYLQIDSAAHPNGDIRGQIAPKPVPEPGDVIISEIMYNPASVETGSSPAEWIELYNPTPSDIDVDGWYFEDEDTVSTDPCTPERSGAMPPFILRSHAVVVVIPNGAGSPPTVEHFETAWGVAGLIDVIQLLPDGGTASGAIVGNNLANTPSNDGNDANDLPLANSSFLPCNINGDNRPDNEILTLVSNGTIIDVVNYDDASLWPADDGAASITLVPADYPQSSDLSTYTATGNDNGANWMLHAQGDAAGGRIQVAAAGVYGGSDIASPGFLMGAISVNLPPSAEAQTLLSGADATTDITLLATDSSRPLLGLLLYLVTSLPQNGTLIDATTGHVIVPGDITGNGYLIPKVPFNQLQYVNGGVCGVDSFTFEATDGVLYSPATPVEIIVQCADAAITELMYNPDSTEATPSKPEWLEILNTSNSPIDLAGWYLEDDDGRGGDLPAYVLGPDEAVAVIPSASSIAEFEAAWNAPVVQATTNGETSAGALVGFNLGNSDGDNVRLVRPGGPNKKVVDALYYRNGGDWPSTASDGVSIYITPPAAQADAVQNDAPDVWQRAADGVDGAYLMNVNPGGIYNGNDIGSPGHVAGITPVSCPATADQNGDGLVTSSDFAHFALCFQGPLSAMPGNCDCFDANDDQHLDLVDFAFLQGAFESP